MLLDACVRGLMLGTASQALTRPVHSFKTRVGAGRARACVCVATPAAQCCAVARVRGPIQQRLSYATCILSWYTRYLRESEEGASFSGVSTAAGNGRSVAEQARELRMLISAAHGLL